MKNDKPKAYRRSQTQRKSLEENCTKYVAESKTIYLTMYSGNDVTFRRYKGKRFVPPNLNKYIYEYNVSDSVYLVMWLSTSTPPLLLPFRLVLGANMNSEFKILKHRNEFIGIQCENYFVCHVHGRRFETTIFRSAFNVCIIFHLLSVHHNMMRLFNTH